MAKLRVLVVEDSLTIRKRLVEVLSSDANFEVIGEAPDGRTAIELCTSMRPDVITMDMVLPGINGLAATEHIMGHCPTPILIVSASFNRGDVFTTYDALAAGAVDVFEKPRGDEADGLWERGFLSALRMVSRVHVITHPRARLSQLRSQSADIRSKPAPHGGELVVALGASTGGPNALVDVLSALPRGYPWPVLVVMHINAAFAPMFADWLKSQLTRDVAYARSGEQLSALRGCVRMAPADTHLTVQGGVLQLTAGPERHSCRPSVDVLFESLARECGGNVVACLLTGMGRDGAAGLLALRRSGARTIAQNEETCVVYGMPREAVQLGAAESVLGLGQFGPSLAALGSTANGVLSPP
jgi:two-component system chemotaxis response regulator CheB